MLKFLLDANLSWETRDYLHSMGYQTYTVAQFNLSSAEDAKIAEFASKKKFIIITLDLDFGQIYYFSSRIPLGVVILRLNDQTVESVNENLTRLLASKILNKDKFHRALIVVDEQKIRIRVKN